MIHYLDDLESDFSRFHRIDDIYQMDGPRFMRLAWRVSAYQGVMALRLNAQQPRDEEVTAPSAATALPPSMAGDVQWMDSTAFAMMT